MLIWLANHLAGQNPIAAAYYLLFRGMMAAMTAFILGLVLGKPMIRYLQRMQIGQVIREEGPQSHYSKRGTPTMGGFLILLAMSLSVLLWSDLHNPYVWITLIVTLVLAVIGWLDDHYKKVLKHSRGLRSRWKYFWQSAIAIIAAILLHHYLQETEQTGLLIPFTKSMILPLGTGFILLAYFVIVGSSNAVNLTDGLDGLAILPVVLVVGALAIFAFISGNSEFSQCLHLPYIPGAGELMVFSSALIGAGLGFLWYNAYPAQVFMGDVGALALGGALGIIAIVVRQELVLAIMGGIFVIEALSVILQVGSYKLTKKRIFKMAPIHHHFELKGWPETRVTVRFWIITFILVLVGLSSIVLR